MACGPTQRLIFPTTDLCVAEITAGDTAGPCTPKAVPGDGDPDTDDPNCGTLSPVFAGVPVSQDSLPAEICFTSSGGPGEAGFTWDATGASPLADPVAVGQDEFWIQDHHTSFFSNTEPEYAPFGGTAATFCGDSKELIIAGGFQTFLTTGSIIRLKKRVLLGDNFLGVQTWTVIDVDTSAIPGAPDMAGESTSLVTQIQQANQRSVAIEWLDNGTLLMAYTYFDEDNKLRIGLIKSMDCGVTWSAAVRVLNPNYELLPKYGIQMRKSGSWVRLQFFTDDPGPTEMVHIASGDFGASFAPDELSGFFVFASNPSDADTAWSLVGLGAGVFAAFGAGPGPAFQHVKVFGGDAYNISQASSFVPIDGTELYGLTAAVCWDQILVVAQHSDGPGTDAQDQITVFRAQVSELQPGNATPWIRAEYVTGWKGVRHHMRMMHSQCVGGRALWVGSTLWDEVTASVEPGTHCLHLASVSPRPMGRVPWGIANGFDQAGVPEAQPLAVSWSSMTQQPAGSATDSSPDTGWLFVNTAPAGAVVYRPDSLTVNATAALGQQCSFRYVPPLAPVWMDGGFVVGGVVACTSGSSRTATSHGVRVRTRDSIIDIRVAVDGIRVVEVGGPLLVEVLKNMSVPTHFRVWVDDNGSPNTCTLTVWEERAPALTFQEASSTAAVGVGPQPQRIDFGKVQGPGGVAGVTVWREVFLVNLPSWASKYDRLTTDPDFPGLNGIIAGPEICLDESLSVSFTGGGAVAGDKFTVLPCYQYPIENVFRDGCQLGWRSEFGPVLGGQVIVFSREDEQPLLGNTVWVCGVETDTVEVRVFNAGGAGSITRTLDLRCFVGLQAFAPIGDTIQIATTPVRRPFDGQLNGTEWRVRFTSGAHIGEIYCITEHCAGRIRLDSFDGPPSSVAPGDTFDVFKTSGWINLTEAVGGSDPSQPFIREFVEITLPPEVHTCTGDHRLAGIMYGCTVTVPIPLQWTHSDDIQTDVQLFETAGGYSWGFERGPARRVWTGRVVNDYLRWREAVRAIHSAIGWNSSPILFVPDESDPCSTIYGRLNPASLDNSFWWPGEDDAGDPQMWPGGDIALQIVEVP